MKSRLSNVTFISGDLYTYEYILYSMKTIISKFFFVLVLTIYVNTTFAQQEATNTFRFPFLPGDELWQKYETHRERVAALQIPADILPRFTT